MFRTPGNPNLFFALLGFVERMNHLRGNKRIVVAVNEEHGVGALPHLFDGRRLAKAPAVLDLAKQRGGVQEREI